MKIVKKSILFLIVALMIIFTVQNSERITIDMFNWSVTLPVSLIIICNYLLGMTTGGILFSIIKRLMASNDGKSIDKKMQSMEPQNREQKSQPS